MRCMLKKANYVGLLKNLTICGDERGMARNTFLYRARTTTAGITRARKDGVLLNKLSRDALFSQLRTLH